MPEGKQTANTTELKRQSSNRRQANRSLFIPHMIHLESRFSTNKLVFLLIMQWLFDDEDGGDDDGDESSESE